MRKYQFYFVLTLIVMLVLGTAGCRKKNRVVEPKDGPAHLTVNNNILQLGTIEKRAGIIEQEVLLLNDGGENLILNGVENLCNCTHAEYEEQTINPGCGTRMRIYLNPSDFTPGQNFSRTIIVHSNGGNAVIELMGKTTD